MPLAEVSPARRAIALTRDTLCGRADSEDLGVHEKGLEWLRLQNCSLKRSTLQSFLASEL